MGKFYLEGPKKLTGEVLISGSKNSALPILFASLLTEEEIELHNIPKLKDIDNTIQLLQNLGAKIKKNKTISINSKNIYKFTLSSKYSKKTRASIFTLASLISRFGQGKIALPGGCCIGNRPIDLHIQGLKKLGAKIYVKENILIATLKKNGLQGKKIRMKKISVGATISLIIAATLAKGETTIFNAAKEPEVKDTANFLNSIGANIRGAGTKIIFIKGVKKLYGGSYKILPDRIETGTFLVAGAISKGKIICLQTKPSILRSVIFILKKAGANIKTGKNWIKLDMTEKRPKAINVTTKPYPGFPTDMQAQFTLLNAIAKGTGIIKETIFENRFMHIPNLIKMGASILKNGNKIICNGKKQLIGSKVIATDIRSSASLVLAGCIANGKTTIKEIEHIDRGYEKIEKKLNLLGAKIKRINK